MAKHEFGEALALADALADFANLQPAEAPAFRLKHPNFAPPMWWDTKPRIGNSSVGTPEWLNTQRLLREAWREKFPPDSCIRLIGDWSNFAWFGQQAQQTNDLIQSGDEAALIEMMKDPAFFVQPRAFDAQRAVMFMYVQAWRAAFCVGCSRPFVRATKTSRYCSQACFDANRSRSQLEYWRTTGVKLRAKRSKAKAGRTKK